MIIVAVAAYAVVRDQALDQVDRSLVAASARVIAELDDADISADDFDATPGPTPEQGPRTPPGTDLEIEVRDAGELTPGGPRTVTLDGVRYRTMVRELTLEDGTTERLSFYRSLSDVEQTIQIASGALVVAGILATLLAVPAVLLIVNAALAPLGVAHRAAESIADSGDLSIRVPAGRPDEVGLLARTINTMLGRVQATQSLLTRNLDEQRRFAADASHELRTPLTALRGDIEFLSHRDPPAEERAAVLDEMNSAVARMSHLTEGLLSLARMEHRDGSSAGPVALVDLVEDLRLDDEPLSASDAARAARTTGDAAALRATIGNLLENARRYGGRPSLTVELADDHLVVVVSDDGPGIAPDDRERIFDRFFRGRRERNSTEGAGLGLAIARHGVESCGGSLRLLDRTPGAHFEVSLPLAPPPPGDPVDDGANRAD